jgi:hypothetical protein
MPIGTEGRGLARETPSAVWYDFGKVEEDPLKSVQKLISGRLGGTMG